MSNRSASPEAARAFTRMWGDLEPVGRHDSSGGYRRYAWTRTDHDLREWFAGECAARGLDLVTDRAGNQWGWWGDPDAAVAAGAPGVVIGSHLDSVPDGGAFDGPLGVVSALAAVDHLREAGVTPARPVGVVSFTDEEGARFGVACTGSRIVTGAMTPERARGLKDADGTTMAEAMTRSGGDPDRLGRDDETLARVGTFVELHIEQGRVLELTGDALGVGSDIWPHGRWRFDIPGMANHAGTTALDDREDAMLGLAAAVFAARRAAETHGALATIGKVDITPGGVNAIPSCATGWLDARAADPAAVRRVVADLRAAIAEYDGLVTEESWTPSTSFDPLLAQRVSGVLGGAPVMGTGAGHDAGILANAGIPTAMLFVRNPTGVSHSPDEWASSVDCLVGVAGLADVVADLVGPAAA